MNKIEILGAKETLYVEHLDNGLDIYMIPNNKVKNYYVTLNTKFGSIHTDFEYDGKDYSLPNGIAHFLEHLTFNLPDENAFEHFSNLGASVNAFTSYDVTCYEVFANSRFKENVEYLIKYVYTPYYTKELVNSEKGVILEEVKMYKDRPSIQVVNSIFDNLYINDKHQFLVGGTVEDVKDIKLEDIEIAYKAFYHPENMFMILTGDFNPEEAVAIINDSMNKFKFDEYIKPVLKKVNEPFKIKTEYSEREMNVDKYKVSFGVKIPKNNFKSLKLSKVEIKMYLNLISRINFGRTSILLEELTDNSIISDEISTMLIETEDCYVQVFIASTDYPDYLIKKLKDAYDNLAVSEEEIERKVKSTLSSFILMFDSIEYTNGEIQDDVIEYGQYLSDVYSIYKKLNIDTANDVIDCLEKRLCSVSVIKPKEKKEL